MSGGYLLFILEFNVSVFMSHYATYEAFQWNFYLVFHVFHFWHLFVFFSLMHLHLPVLYWKYVPLVFISFTSLNILGICTLRSISDRLFRRYLMVRFSDWNLHPKGTVEFCTTLPSFLLHTQGTSCPSHCQSSPLLLMLVRLSLIHGSGHPLKACTFGGCTISSFEQQKVCCPLRPLFLESMI